MALTLGSTSATQGVDFSTVVSGFTATDTARYLTNGSLAGFQLQDLSDTTMTLLGYGLAPGAYTVEINRDYWAAGRPSTEKQAFTINVARASPVTPFTATVVPQQALAPGDTINVPAPTITGGSGSYTYRLLRSDSLTVKKLPTGYTFSGGALGGTMDALGLYGVVIEVSEVGTGRKTWTQPFSLPSIGFQVAAGGGAFGLTYLGEPLTYLGEFLTYGVAA